MDGVSIHLHVHQKGNVQSEDQASDNRTEGTPTPSDNIKIFGDVSFSHRISPPANGKSVGSFLGITVNGRVDHEIGLVIPPTPSHRGSNHHKRRFRSLLLLIEAKTELNLNQALPQLVVYLASLHQSRLQRQRSDATVYGVVSDGYGFIFITISHYGVLQQSRSFDVNAGEMLTVLGCLRYMLEMSASMSPNVTPEKVGDEDHSNLDSYNDSDMDIDNSDSPPE